MCQWHHHSKPVAWVSLWPDNVSASPSIVKPLGYDSSPQKDIMNITTAPYPLPTHTSGNMATNIPNPLTLHKCALGSMMSVLSPTIIAYIADIISQQVWQQENGNDATLINLTRLGSKWCWPSSFRMSQFMMFNGSGKPSQHLAHFISRCRLVISSPPAVRDALFL